MLEQLVEVVGADVVRVFAKGGYSRVYLLGPFLVCRDFRELAQVAPLLARIIALEPLVDVDARSRGACVQNDSVVPCADTSGRVPGRV